MNTNYSPMIAIDHDGHSRLYETPYTTCVPYSDYSSSSKLEALEYNYWQNTNATHNISTLPHSSAACPSLLDPAQTAPPSTNSLLESLIPVHVSQMNHIPPSSSSSTTTISATHHHHHIHQHLFPNGTLTPSSDTPNWFNAADYPSPNASYRPYSYGNNTFYDQAHWSTPISTVAMKFETPYSPPSYAESSHQLDQPYVDSKEEPAEYSDDRFNCCKAQFTPVPPKNPANGMVHLPLFGLSHRHWPLPKCKGHWIWIFDFNTRFHLSVSADQRHRCWM